MTERQSIRHIFVPIFILLVSLGHTRTAAAQRDGREVTWVNPGIAKMPGLEHRILKSEAMGHDVGYAVWTPPGFDAKSKLRYPVVYFLHGSGGSEASDSGGFSTFIANAIAKGKFPSAICVFPNGGLSGYRNQVESMIVDELIPLIDADYPTQAAASGRVLAGFSMGGAGSVHLSLNHPRLFCAAVSWGGALSRHGDGADSPLLPSARKHADTLKKSNYALLTINGDQDHPDGFAPLKQVLAPLDIPHRTVTLEDTNHNLGRYYELSGNTLVSFLAAQLKGTKTSCADAANGKTRTIRVLTIGNSFAKNACEYLEQIAADGSVELVIGKANLGGCTLERHARLAQEFENDPKNQPYRRTTDQGTTRLSLQEYLAVERWDYVTIQQMSALSYQIDTYQPHVDDLVNLIRKHAPQAQLLVHETWAYRPDSPYLKQHGLSQAQMYAGLSKAYSSIANQYDATIIPVGTAFQKVRNTKGRLVVVPDPNFDFDNPVFPKRPNQSHSLVAGWFWDKRGEKPELKLDFKHANASGCYLAGLVWYETITGSDARKIKYVPRGVDESDAAFFREVAHQVVLGRDLRSSRTPAPSLQ